MKNTFSKQEFNQESKDQVAERYLNFYNENLKNTGISVYFDNLSYSNGMSVYISFVKVGSETLQIRHSDHVNGVGNSILRCSFDLKANADLIPSELTVQRVIEILEKYKN